jgi:hypothetical protein
MDGQLLWPEDHTDENRDVVAAFTALTGAVSGLLSSSY